MSEILQKVKGQSAMPGQTEDDSSSFASNTEEAQDNNNKLDTTGTVNVTSDSTPIDTSNDYLAKSAFHPVHVNGVHSSTSHDLYSESTSDGEEKHVSSSPSLIDIEQESTYALTSSRTTNSEPEKQTVDGLSQYSEGSSTIQEFSVNGTEQVSENDELVDMENTVVRIINTAVEFQVYKNHWAKR